MTLLDLNDSAGIAQVGHHGHTRRLPRLHATGQVDGVVATLDEDGRRPLRPPAHPTHGHNRLVLVEAVDAGGQRRERHVEGVGRVPGLPLVGFSHVEQKGAFVDSPGRLFGSDGRNSGLALHTTKL